MLGIFLKNIIEDKIIDKAYMEEKNIKLISYKNGEVLIDQSQNIDYIDFLLEGKVYTSVFLKNGDRIISDQLESPQFFGLVEILNNRKTTLGRLVALTKIKILRIPLSLFKTGLKEDLDLLTLSLDYVAEFSVNLLEQNILKNSLSTDLNILNYLYHLSKNQELPFRLSFKKTFLADVFSVNVRTIYRYLNLWEKDELIKRVGQDIEIDKEGLKKIRDLLKEIEK